MELKQKIYAALKNPDFPDLSFLYSEEVLERAPEILIELLEQEKIDFETKLTTPDNEINFLTFEEFSELDYFFGILEHYQGVNNTEQIRKIIEDFEPAYIDFGNEVSYSKRYYDMLVYCNNNTVLSAEQARILEKSIEAFEVRGIALASEKQTELKEINKKLSELSQKFANNVLDAQNEFEYIIIDEAIVSEMPADDREVAKKKAEEKKKEGYLFDASHSSYSSIMKYCSDSDVRKEFYDARNSFGALGKYDNRENILAILGLRHKKSKLLGFKNYGELSLHFKMAESPQQVIELFESISSKAKVKGKEELREIEAYFKLSELKAWDISYYANKLRQEKYEFDSRELKKYFEFEAVLAGMFEIVRRLYGLEMKQCDIKSYDADVEVYEVHKDGVFLSYFFTDFFYRPLKRSGAWANIMREKYGIYKKITLNVCNFQKGSDGKTLLTMSDVETMFHEFGHATHEMLSRSEHSELSGFHVEWDFVELPSQILENWCREKQGLDIFAKHHETGAKMPDNLLQKFKTLENFGNGQFVVAQNTYAMMDMNLHSGNIPDTPEALDLKVRDICLTHAIMPLTENYSPHTSFSHIFDGGYAAGYYSYMWAEIIEKEVWKAFKDSGDIFSPEVSRKFHDTILSQGSTKKASELFEDFMGREVQIDAFLSEKGLI